MEQERLKRSPFEHSCANSSGHRSWQRIDFFVTKFPISDRYHAESNIERRWRYFEDSMYGGEIPSQGHVCQIRKKAK